MRPSLVFPLLLAVAAASAPGQTPTPTPSPTPQPNTRDISVIAGNYRGLASVTLDSGAIYQGRNARITVEAATPFAIRVRITAVVRPEEGRRVSVNNRLSFRANGVLEGREIAPGAAKNAPFRGLYTATTRRRLTFSGAYEYGSSRGTFSGSLQRTPKDRLILSYSMTAEETTRPIYTYRYSTRLQKRRR